MMNGIVSFYTDDLLCCPNCGSKAWITEVRFNDGDVWYRPECSCCNVTWKENYPSITEAEYAWNEHRGATMDLTKLEETDE